MFDAASDIRIDWSVVEKCLQPLMASTMLDVPALDIVKLTLAVGCGFPCHRFVRKGKQKLFLTCNGACKNCWPELSIHCVLNDNILLIKVREYALQV